LIVVMVAQVQIYQNLLEYILQKHKLYIAWYVYCIL
jgi:hypothetical protein